MNREEASSIIKQVAVIMANLISQGLVEQTESGIRPTEKGIKRAEDVWEKISDDDKILLIPYLRKHLHLAFNDELTL